MKSESTKSQKELVLKGMATSPGIAIGPAYPFRPLTINLTELEVKIDDVEREYELFENAIRKVREQLEYAQRYSEEIYEKQFSDIFESQLAFLQDHVLINEIQQDIKHTRHSTAYVVSNILSKKSEYFINLENIYFRDRAYDILDLKQKLIHALLGINVDYQLSTPSIVVAEMLTPSDTIHFNRNFILGFLTDKGGKTSHAAIMARGLRIPSVVNGHTLSRIIQQDDLIIIDGFDGTIILNPLPATTERYKKLRKDYHDFEKTLSAQIAKPPLTKDQQAVQLLANIEFVHEVRDVKYNRAEGIGLFRTESIYIEKGAEPSEEEQFAIYRQLVEQMAPQEVTIRTVDLGGDKLVDGYATENEMNPFMGWRAIRFCLDKPEFFKVQLRAIYRASCFGKVKILIPMISSIDEILETKKLIEEVKEELSGLGLDFNTHVPLGVMIETPAAAILAKFFARYVDFFSIGTNDLTQYVLAIDRTNEKVSKAYNTFNPAVLEFVAKTIGAALENKKDVTLCGEFAATHEAIPLLLGMGLRSFSMNPHSLPEAKKIIRSFEIEECEKLYSNIKKLHTAKDIEALCSEFLEAHVPDLQFLR